MDQTEFREFGHAMVDYIINYRENIRDRDVYPSVEPGYLYSRIPTEMPQTPDSWQNVLNDVEMHIMPGITHWQSPRFHAYFPTASSYPSILGEMLAASLGVIGFSWITSPACTELEVVMMNWLGKLIGLPSQFLNCSEGPGGGIIQGSASEATLIGLLAAKEKTVHRLKRENPEIDEHIIRTKLVSYTSDQSNSSVEKAGLLASVPMRLLPADAQGKLTAAILSQAIQQDIYNGLIPCYVVATLGTTGTCAFDDLQEIGPICEQHNIWLHVDAAYAGAAFICPEYQQLMAGVEYADSFDINCHKWMLVNFDCSAMWLKNTNDLNNAFNVDRLYLESNVTSHIPDFRHWQIPLGRRFRALKLWFTLRLYGVVGLQAHIRKHINLAKLFEQVVTQDDRFEIVVPAVMGLVGFRLKGDNSLSRLLLDRILLSRQLYMVPAIVNDQFTIRFVVCSEMTTEQDIHHDWVAIQKIATNILSNNNTIENDAKNIENGSIGENIDVESIENGFISENIDVKSIENGSIGENIDVKSIENGFISENIDVKSIENGFIGENIDVKSIENGFISENIDVKSIENGSIGENIDVKSIENGFIGENIDVKSIENGSIGEDIDVKSIENGSIGENVDVKNIENGSIGENIDVKSIENGFISESIDVKSIENGSIGENIDVKSIENGPFSEIIEKKEKCFANTVITLVKKEKTPKNVCIGK